MATFILFVITILCFSIGGVAIYLGLICGILFCGSLFFGFVKGRVKNKKDDDDGEFEEIIVRRKKKK